MLSTSYFSPTQLKLQVLYQSRKLKLELELETKTYYLLEYTMVHRMCMFLKFEGSPHFQRNVPKTSFVFEL